MKQQSTETVVHKVILKLFDNINEGTFNEAHFFISRNVSTLIGHRRLLFKLGIKGDELE